MKRFNAVDGALDLEQDRDGYSWRAARFVGKRLGASLIGASVYELPAGQRSFPFHYHHGVEEWLYVVAGTPSVRTPAGEQPLKPGDLICFPSGADGGHTVTGPGRVMMFSANREPSISVYPDSDKIGPRPGSGPDRLDFRRGDSVDYWDGE
jgi:uncharacterized cupin superfamily protein